MNREDGEMEKDKKLACSFAESLLKNCKIIERGKVLLIYLFCCLFSLQKFSLGCYAFIITPVSGLCTRYNNNADKANKRNILVTRRKQIL